MKKFFLIGLVGALLAGCDEYEDSFEDAYVESFVKSCMYTCVPSCADAGGPYKLCKNFCECSCPKMAQGMDDDKVLAVCIDRLRG